jgi:hypothetical protein
MANIYLCGTENFENDIDKVKAKLRRLRFDIINIQDISTLNTTWSDSLTKRIELLKKSHAIYVLPSWRENAISRIELTIAMDLKLHLLFHPVTNKEIKQLITTLDS